MSLILAYLVVSVALTGVIVFTCQALWARLTKSKLEHDFEQAIRKKQRLEEQQNFWSY